MFEHASGEVLHRRGFCGHSVGPVVHAWHRDEFSGYAGVTQAFRISDILGVENVALTDPDPRWSQTGEIRPACCGGVRRRIGNRRLAIQIGPPPKPDARWCVDEAATTRMIRNEGGSVPSSSVR